jgi:hypothetical protein
MQTLTAVLNQLKKEQIRLSSQLQHVSAALAALGGVTNGNRGGTMSVAGRARVAAAQRARWAKVKGTKVVSIARRKRRRISPAAIARIRAAQKARWAKWRKAQKN